MHEIRIMTRTEAQTEARLELLPRNEYVGVNALDPIRLYYWPVVGRLYRRRVELCLNECTGGERVLEIGFGSGVTFPALSRRYREIHGLDLTADTARVHELFARRGIETQLKPGNVLDMPYPENHFDTVLLISILEHLKVSEQERAFAEIRRVLKPGGQVIYGTPIERPLMVVMFRLLRYNIREHHFSTEKDIRAAAAKQLKEVRVIGMPATPSFLGNVYEIGHFTKHDGG
jgi:ubiquinone/menaquinone biosynthesis C-methylase UbiE